ncbi:MAG: ferrochelatase [Vicingaceae bacterium]
MSKKGVLLINLGTPESFKVKDVRKYLREFLMDKYVIDIPFFNRWLLVNLIIAPFRAPKSAKEYKKVWTEKGSPLLTYGLELEKEIQQTLGNDFFVKMAMRYQNPSIKHVLKAFRDNHINEILAIPLYPQYADATTGSTIEKVNLELKQIADYKPSVKFINYFYHQDFYLQTFIETAKEQIKDKSFDHFVFSYHGLPERQILKSSANCSLNETCCAGKNKFNEFCYRFQCFETTRLIANKLNINENNYSVCFQSRLGKQEWIKPYTEQVIKELAQKDIKNIAVFAPSFIADCLETTVEIGEQYKNLFLELGGESLTLIDSLNNHPVWISNLSEFIQKQC